MASLHEVTSAKDGTIFISIGPVSVFHQNNPKTSKNNKLYSTVVLKNAGTELVLMLWDKAAEWKLPIGDTVTLKGKFTKNTYNGAASLNCEDLQKPEGAVPIRQEDVQGPMGKPTIKQCVDAGLRAADYMIRKERPELAEAAFTFGANACLQGLKPE